MVGLALTILLAAASYRWLESPFFAIERTLRTCPVATYDTRSKLLRRAFFNRDPRMVARECWANSLFDEMDASSLQDALSK